MRAERFAWLAVLLLVCVGNAHADGQIECTTQNYRYTYCRVDTGNVVQLPRQQSQTRCDEGATGAMTGAASGSMKVVARSSSTAFGAATADTRTRPARPSPASPRWRSSARS